MAGFSYYYGSDAEQFNFFRLPKKLIRDKQFDRISSEAKILYGMLLDRMALSARNGWLDEENRVYIIYPVKEVAEELNCSERKAITLMAELDTKNGIGLIEKKRQGLGKPNILYVKNFNSNTASATVEQKPQVKRPEQPLPTMEPIVYGKKVEVCDEGDSLIIPDMQDCSYPDMQDCSYPDMQDRSYPDMQDRSCPDMQDRSCPDMQKCAGHSKTDYTKTDINNTLSIYPSVSNPLQTEGDWNNRALVLQTLQHKLDYEVLIHDDPLSRQQIDELFRLLTDACCYSEAIQRIGGGTVATRDIRARFMQQLTANHIRYVLYAIQQNPVQVKNIRAYLLTCLYNAPSTMGNFYQSEVGHAFSGRGG